MVQNNLSCSLTIKNADSAILGLTVIPQMTHSYATVDIIQTDICAIMYYTQKIRDSDRQHPIRHVRQCRNADWRENWTTPWKCLANAWEAFLIPGSSNFTDEFFSDERGTSFGSAAREQQLPEEWTIPWELLTSSLPKLKDEGVCICVLLLLLAAVMVQESLRPTFRLPIGVSNAGAYTEWTFSVNYCKCCFVDSESRVLQH